MKGKKKKKRLKIMKLRISKYSNAYEVDWKSRNRVVFMDSNGIG